MRSTFGGFVLVLIGLGVGLRVARAAEGAPRTLPRRIISLSPSVTEILHGVGAFDRVVAVSSYCTHPPGVAGLPRVGGWLDTNWEQMAALDPDLVILIDAQAPLFQERLDALGLPALVVGAQTLEDVFEAMEAIGGAVGKSGEAASLAHRTRWELESIRERTQDLARPRVLCVVDRLPGTLRDLYVATRGSFLTELIEIAGARPITPPSFSNYADVGPEAVVALDPDVILDLVQGISPPAALASAGGRWGEDPRAVWGELAGLRAVKEGRVYSLRDDALIHPSQRVARAARRLAETLHPEVFREP